VHEAYIRLVDQRGGWQDRAHFFAIAAQAMRRILVDHARAHRASKRGGIAERISLDDTADRAGEREVALEDVLEVDSALSALEALDPAAARIVELRYFGGLTIQETAAAMARAERKIQKLESGFTFEARRRHLLLGMRNHILKANPRVSLADSYRYAELALAACEKYPAVDPLLLLAIGIVESGYNAQARSPADARGLYQIWPSTGRLLARTLGWTYDDSLLYDPEKNTQAAALYLDVLFSTYKEPQMVLAEYNGGPLNAGYLRAGVAALAAETRNYVPRVLELHQRLQEEFQAGTALALQAEAEDGSERGGKRLVAL